MILALALGCAAEPAGRSVTALVYATSERFPHRALIADAPDDRVPAAWLVGVIRDGDRVVLVDTGPTPRPDVAKWGLDGFRTVDVALGDLGLTADDVDDVILTHLHWDHAGNVAAFPRARVWVQRDALTWARAAVADGQPHKGVDPADLAALDAVGARLHVLDGDAEVAPGVRVVRAGGHTPGVMWVRVDAAVGPVVLASDVVSVWENLERGVPPGGSLDPDADRAAGAAILAVTGRVDRVVPGHDAGVLDRLTPVGPRAGRVR